jgi:dolichyl-phosphate beta-glucosyltransferase
MRTPDLSIVIPCYNEEGRLPATLRDIAKYLITSSLVVEIIVVDDGSKDNTVEVAASMQKLLPMLRLLPFTKNRGKGHAVKHGILTAKGKLVLFMDADNSTPIREVEKLLPFTNQYPVVIGSRHLHESNVVIKQPLSRIIISRLGNLLIQALLIRGIRDTQCGFKLFQKNAAQDIFAKQRTTGFGFDMEVLAIAQKIFHYKIKEVPVSWYNSQDSRVRPIHDAWRTLKDLFRIKQNLLTGLYKKAS